MSCGILTEKNVGGIDLMVRSLLGTVSMVVLALGLVAGSLKWVVAVVAFLGVFTSLTRHCLLYSLLGVTTKTCKNKVN